MKARPCVTNRGTPVGAQPHSISSASPARTGGQCASNSARRIRCLASLRRNVTHDRGPDEIGQRVIVQYGLPSMTWRPSPGTSGQAAHRQAVGFPAAVFSRGDLFNLELGQDGVWAVQRVIAPHTVEQRPDRSIQRPILHLAPVQDEQQQAFGKGKHAGHSMYSSAAWALPHVGQTPRPACGSCAGAPTYRTGRGTITRAAPRHLRHTLFQGGDSACSRPVSVPCIQRRPSVISGRMEKASG